jgi:acetyl esterase
MKDTMHAVEILDLPYRTVGGETLLGRLYQPADAGAKVVLVDVHGGGWMLNDRLANAPIHEHLAGRGIAVFALDFRMAPKHRYPAAVDDVNYGIRWLKSNLERLGLRPAQIGGLGTSSGGHQIVLSALRPDDARYLSPDPALTGHDASLDFVIACWPVLDPLARYRMAKARNLKNLVEAHDAFWPDEAAMTEGNPQLVVERGEASARPPMLVLQGTADENVEHERADRFAQAYRGAGGELQLEKFEGQPHAFVLKDPGAAASLRALDLITAYVRSRVTKEKTHG